MCDNKNNLLHQDGGLTRSELTTNGYDNHRTPNQYITLSLTSNKTPQPPQKLKTQQQ